MLNSQQLSHKTQITYLVEKVIPSHKSYLQITLFYVEQQILHNQ